MTECIPFSLSDFDLADLNLSELDLSDQSYRITRAGQDSPALALSISAAGVLTPPAVVERVLKKEQGRRFAVVSGFRRLEAACSLGHTRVLCRVYPPGDEAGCARLAVAENAFCRELAPGELVRAVQLLSGFMDAETLAAQSREIFNTWLNRNYVDTLVKIGRLKAPVLALLDSGQLAIKAAKALTALSGEEAALMADLFSKIKASSGKQMEMIVWARESAARESIGLDRLLDEEAPRFALDAPAGNRDMGAAANRVRAALHARRFPELDAARNRAVSLVRDLKLPGNIRMTLPDNFESMVYSLALNFTSPVDYADGIAALSDLESHPSLYKLLNR